MRDRRQKIDTLRNLEGIVYQIAYHLLDDMKGAVEVSKQTLLQAMGNERFFQWDEAERNEWIRKQTIRHALERYKSRNQQNASTDAAKCRTSS